MDNNKYTIPLAIVAAGALIAWGFFATNNSNPTASDGAKDAAQEIQNNNNNIKISFEERDHILGNPDALVKIITFTDLECPYCKAFHETMLKITDEYAKGGKVAWSFRQFPVHGDNAKMKAKATECAGKLGGESKFWEMTQKIFEPINNEWISTEKLPVIAMELGLDTKDFNACLEDENSEITKKIEDNFQNGVDLKVTGTPTSFIFLDSGEIVPISGAQPYKAVKSMIDMILQEKS